MIYFSRQLLSFSSSIIIYVLSFNYNDLFQHYHEYYDYWVFGIVSPQYRNILLKNRNLLTIPLIRVKAWANLSMFPPPHHPYKAAYHVSICCLIMIYARSAVPHISSDQTHHTPYTGRWYDNKVLHGVYSSFNRKTLHYNHYTIPACVCDLMANIC